MAKINRQVIHQKYGGKCAYCGKDITLKEMQVDHIWPKWMEGAFPDGSIHAEGNLNPSCRRCNHYKRAEHLEGFRQLMLTLHERIEKIYISKVAIDFGIVTVKPFSGKFYFETLNQTH